MSDKSYWRDLEFTNTDKPQSVEVDVEQTIILKNQRLFLTEKLASSSPIPHFEETF